MDALPPEVLSTLIRAAIEPLFDRAKMDAVKAQEQTDKRELALAVDRILKRRR